MDKNIRVLMMVIGVVGLLSRANAETPEDQRSRCNAYAEQSVAQYNSAAAHPQCHINVDLVWQPSRDFHFAVCMKVSRTVAEQTAATRDNVLQGCATAPVQASTIPLPAELKQCERSLLKFCGTWTLRGEQYMASWSNGAKGTVSVTSFDGQSIALHRVDPADSTTPELTADYLGAVDGGKIKGKVTYTWPGHNPPVGYGTWDATFTPTPPGPIPSVPPTQSHTPASPSSAATLGASTVNAATTPGTPLPTSPIPNSASTAGCVVPAVPENWTNAEYKRSIGNLWKLENGVLSYNEFTDSAHHRVVSFRVSRPKIWTHWMACARRDAVPSATYQGGLWIWISDDRREAKVFNLDVSGNHIQAHVVSMPASVVLAEEAQ